MSKAGRERHEAEQAERERLLELMAMPHEVRPNWVRFKRPGTRIRSKVLRKLSNHLEGRFFVSKKRVCIENEADALIYQLLYPSSVKL